MASQPSPEPPPATAEEVLCDVPIIVYGHTFRCRLAPMHALYGATPRHRARVDREVNLEPEVPGGVIERGAEISWPAETTP